MKSLLFLSEDRSKVVGSLVFQRAQSSMDAHCVAHKVGNLSWNMNRKLTGHPSASRSAQGRPLGHLVAWLWASDVTPKAEHAKLRRGKGLHANLVSHDVRSRARSFLEEDPHFVEWLERTGAQERPRRDGEEPEPRDVP